VTRSTIEHVATRLEDMRIGEQARATVLLPLDQFEEVFTVDRQAARRVPASARRRARSRARPAAHRAGDWPLRRA
jgi:hypothetical protein